MGHAPEAPCVGLQHGLPVRQFAFGQSTQPTYPLNPPYAGGPGHIPSWTVDGWTCFKGRRRQTAYPPRGIGDRAVESTSYRLP